MKNEADILTSQNVKTKNTETVPEKSQQKRLETDNVDTLERKSFVQSYEGFGKVIAILAVVTTIFGASFQKGMFLEMGIQNIRGSYEIEEVFSSAFVGYIHILTPLLSVEFTDVFMSFAWVVISFIIISILIFIIQKWNLKITGPINKVIDIAKKPSAYVSDSFIKTTTFSAIIGLLVSAFSTLATFILMGVLVILIFPAISGVAVGQAYVNKYMRGPVCIQISEDSLKENYIHQCPQFTLNNINLSAQVVMQNKEGYFLRLNNAFLYVSNDAKICVYSHFNKSEDVNKVGIEKFEFEQTKIRALCENVEFSTSKV